MDALFSRARDLLSQWKGENYVFGRGVLGEIGKIAGRFGKSALVAGSRASPAAAAVLASLEQAGVSLAGASPAGEGLVPGAGPNSPKADVYRIAAYILLFKPDMIIAVGGGSTIDACKAAGVLAALGREVSPEIDHWFGTGLVTEALKKTGKKLRPLIAVQTAASSGSHLTKYANVTDQGAMQKKLLVDEAIVPAAAVFDYEVTSSMPVPVTIDGALDSIAHCFEVFSGLSTGGLPAGVPKEKYDLAGALTETALELAVKYTPVLIKNPGDMEAREALGMSSDLGGYAIMIGGTHGPHMTSFSLVELAGHGTACGVMNPYYAVLFAPAIEKQLRLAGKVFQKYGYLGENLEALSGRALGLAVGRGMIAFGKAIGAPSALGELPGWKDSYVDKILAAAKDPQLEMKLRNMPVPLSAALVDEYLGPVIRAAVSGDFGMIKTLC